MKYRIKLSEDAESDMFAYIDAIYFDYDAPLTATRVYRQLMKKIYTLKSNPGIYTIRTEPWYWKYGHFVRRLNFKGVAIIYTIEDDVVLIHRIVAHGEIVNSE